MINREKVIRIVNLEQKQNYVLPLLIKLIKLIGKIMFSFGFCPAHFFLF